MKLENNEYYIELDDVINNSEFSEKELTDVYGEAIDFHLKNASSKVYSIMYGVFGGRDKERQYKAIRYMINNDEIKQRGIREATIEYMRGALYSGMDLNAYTSTGATYSVEVVNILKRYGLWIKATIEYQDEDIEE